MARVVYTQKMANTTKQREPAVRYIVAHLVQPASAVNPSPLSSLPASAWEKLPVLCCIRKNRQIHNAQSSFRGLVSTFSG